MLHGTWSCVELNVARVMVRGPWTVRSYACFRWYVGYTKAWKVLMQGKFEGVFRYKSHLERGFHNFLGKPIGLFSLDFFFRFIFVKFGVIEVMP